MGYWYHRVRFLMDYTDDTAYQLTKMCRYTLAVGKAPFHSAKREEIYKKLQQREYEWPDLAKHQNDISIDLQHLVSTLLVDEDERLSPDEIVSHSFFKIQFIPDHLDSSCTSVKPTWPHYRPPSAETIRRGYSDSWFKLCKVSGVGEYAPGRTFPAVGLVNSSVVKDVEREIKAGKAPSVPIAAGTVYLPFISDRKDKVVAVGTNLSEIAEESSAASSANGSQLTEISANNRVAKISRTFKTASTQRFKENIPPGTTELERQNEIERPQQPAIRRAKSTRARIEDRKNLDPTATIAKRAPVVSSKSSNPPAAEQQLNIVDPLRIKPARPNARSRTASREGQQEAACAVQPVRASRSRTVSREDNPNIELHVQRSRPGTRAKVASREQNPERIPTRMQSMNQLSERPIRPNISRPATQVRATELALPRKPEKKEPPIEEPDPAHQTDTVTITPALVSTSLSSSNNILHNTDPETVLARATRLRNNLLASISNRRSHIHGKERTQQLPFVTKWVDYAKKHGIGYILSDGTLGCVFNATSDQPVRHVLVRDGSFHLKEASGDKTVNIQGIPLEFFSVGSADAIKSISIEGEQRRQNGLLWVKFAKYMCSSLSGTSERAFIAEENTENKVMIVRYYQRLGNVGVWGFSDGCFQVSDKICAVAVSYTHHSF
jgi:hypothetical protein